MDSIQAAKILSVPTAFIMTGYFTASSQNILPILIAQPASISAPVFKQVYQRGLSAMAPLSTIGTLAYAYLAYTARTPRERRLYTAGAVLTISILPWTTGVMKKGIDRLIHLSENSAALAKAESVGEVTSLLSAWTTQNWIRASLVLTGGLVGLLATST